VFVVFLLLFTRNPFWVICVQWNKILNRFVLEHRCRITLFTFKWTSERIWQISHLRYTNSLFRHG